MLQDLINELGRRLDYEVENGLCQGRPNAVGFDGIWHAPDGHSLVIEVKTTDAYRINLDTIAGYREALRLPKLLILEDRALDVVDGKDQILPPCPFFGLQKPFQFGTAGYAVEIARRHHGMKKQAVEHLVQFLRPMLSEANAVDVLKDLEEGR